MSAQHPGHDRFVNPYTFVPFPEVADESGFRRAPAGHARLAAGRYTGRINVELTARSPLLLRGVRRSDAHSDQADRFPRRTFPGTRGEAVPFLPGSSLAGMVRSLHELLSGGCLRVFDADFRPGYRDPVQARDDDWTLAVVDETHEGRPTRLRLCSTVAWVPARRLAELLGGVDKVVTGATVHISGWEEKKYGKGRQETWRNEATKDHWVRPGDDWVVLVTGSGARKKYKSFLCAVGELADGQDSLVPGVTDKAWDDFQRSVAGADDVRRARRDKKLRTDKPQSADVTYQYGDGERLVGKRHEARPVLHQGQVIWVRTAVETTSVGLAAIEKTVTEGMALSHIWRHASEHPAAERVPPVLRPCEDAEQLCPTCRVFGSADTNGSDGPESEQQAYSGHLRFSDARPLAAVTVREEKLAPLGAPRPGAGQFYLEHRTTRPDLYATALREWGSRADTPREGGVRRFRGRKQYWLTGRHQERPLFRVKNRDWDSKMASTAEAVLPGARFGFSVHFSGLDTAELGAVLAALAPQLLLEAGEQGTGIGLAVGGGRPFGFGTCTAEISGLQIDDAASRYAGGDAPDVSVAEAVAAFRKRVDSGVSAIWPAAAAALTLDRVEPGTVWYPPEQPLPRGEITSGKTGLAAGFEFWTQSRGYEERKGTYPLIPLPDPTGADQTLPVLGREHRGTGHGARAPQQREQQQQPQRPGAEGGPPGGTRPKPAPPSQRGHAPRRGTPGRGGQR
ncbi:TIGR03986 family CRISPR-associated RAMP protein [Streptomyces sp. NPDC002896]|uniref:TIGR03986 family type III CRISPR-associated RAMP protein n=1 Tax=Streptomyces sp. NPDC002896 TaxID=3154438 RepID=UPI0033206C28